MDWNPSTFFLPSEPLRKPYALILLNQPINVKAYDVVVKRAKYIVCADGGANHLREMEESYTSGSDQSPRKSPNAIIGDLDSLHPSVEAHYRDLGVAIIRDPDQYSTDLTKCLKWLRQRDSNSDRQLDILTLGGLSGCVDQAFSLIHHLYMASKPEHNHDLLDGQIFLLSEQNISFVLEKGKNKIETRALGEVFAENVGIIPVRAPAVISTTGLEWDVKDWKTEFGGQVSTSNHLRASVVEVETDERVLFTLELARHLGC